MDQTLPNRLIYLISRPTIALSYYPIFIEKPGNKSVCRKGFILNDWITAMHIKFDVDKAVHEFE